MVKVLVPDYYRKTLGFVDCRCFLKGWSYLSGDVEGNFLSGDLWNKWCERGKETNMAVILSFFDMLYFEMEKHRNATFPGALGMFANFTLIHLLPSCSWGCGGAFSWRPDRMSCGWCLMYSTGTFAAIYFLCSFNIRPISVVWFLWKETSWDEISRAEIWWDSCSLRSRLWMESWICWTKQARGVVMVSCVFVCLFCPHHPETTVAVRRWHVHSLLVLALHLFVHYMYRHLVWSRAPRVVVSNCERGMLIRIEGSLLA